MLSSIAKIIMNEWTCGRYTCWLPCSWNLLSTHHQLTVSSHDKRCSCRRNRRCCSNDRGSLTDFFTPTLYSVSKCKHLCIFPETTKSDKRKESNQDHNTITVDYQNIDTLMSILEEHDIHTVISAFAVEGDSLAISQLNLIRAAIRS